MLSKLSCRYLVFAGLVFAGCTSTGTPGTPAVQTNGVEPAVVHSQATSLKEAYAGRFLIGTCYDPGNYSDVELANIKANYNVITPENCMKPAPIHPSENTYSFTRPDALVKFCKDNNIQVIGHNLCWYNQTPNWFFRGPDGAAATKELLTERFKSHISTVVGRYKGQLKGWDVVNEAINDGGTDATGKTENLRNSDWLRILGPQYITMAFKFAHEADPQAELYYNDYNIESGPKHASSMLLLKRLIADGCAITAVGIQGHWDTNPNYTAIEKAINDYKSLGLKVSISELDVTTSGGNSGAFGGGGFGGGGGGGFGRGAAPATQASPQDAAARRAAGYQRQATAYAKLFQLFDKHADTVMRVTLWGINDRRSWKSGQQPLLFDGQMQAKPAFQAILDASMRRDQISAMTSFGNEIVSK